MAADPRKMSAAELRAHLEAMDRAAPPPFYNTVEDIKAATEEAARLDAEIKAKVAGENVREFPRLATKGNGALTLRPAELPEPDAIPPREWLYGTQLIRGFVSVLVAPGGTGKSAYAMAIAIEMATRRSYLGTYIFEQLNVALFNLDDPMVEINRRVAAFMKLHNVSKCDLDGRLFIEDADGHGLTLAEQAKDDQGFYVAHPDEKPLIELLRANNIGLLVCDPFAESHTLEENNNPQMIQAAAAWRRVARAANCAVMLVHHVRKGDVTGIDAARGAKAVTDSARVGLLMTTMSAQEAETFGISDDDRTAYVRLDDAKRNMAPAAKARWFRLRPVELGNTFNPKYPSGDSVAAIVAWKPPDSGLDTATHQDLNSALDAIAAGPEPGILYSKSKAGRSSASWCGNVLVEMLDASEKQAKDMINRWLQSGTLYLDTYRNEKQRKSLTGVRVNNAKRPS